MTLDQRLVLALVVVTMVLTIVGLVLDRARHDRLRRDIALANADAYRAVDGRVRAIQERYEGLEVRLREQELRP